MCDARHRFVTAEIAAPDHLGGAVAAVGVLVPIDAGTAALDSDDRAPIKRTPIRAQRRRVDRVVERSDERAVRQFELAADEDQETASIQFVPHGSFSMGSI